MSGYDRDITLEHRFSKQIRSILGCYFFTQTAWLDQQEATDFAVFTAEPVKVAARLRRNEYLLRYPDEFTIRWSRPSGVKTEIDKIRSGLVDYMLYGFVDESQTRLLKYVICDLDVFRAKEPKPICVKRNNPPDSELAAYKLSQFPPEFVLKLWKYAQLNQVVMQYASSN